MDNARAVEQDIDLTDLGDRCLHFRLVKHVELAGDNARNAFDFLECGLVDVGRIDLGASFRKSQRTCTANALSGGCHQCGFSIKSYRHFQAFRSTSRMWSQASTTSSR